MRRRDFLKGTAAGAAGTAATVAACGGSSGGPATHTTQRVRWRLASSFPRSLDAMYGAAEVLAERVSAATDGNFEIRPSQAGEIVPAFEVLDAVQNGTVQVGQTASYYYKGKNPALSFETCVPFGFNARQQSAWLLEGGGLELVNELLADFGIRSFVGGNTGVQMGGWFRDRVEGVADLRGLKMRIPGLGAEVMDELGVNVQVLPGADIYLALEQGTIDATEWVGPYDDEKLGFHKVAKNYYYPGWWEPGPSLSFYVGLEAWNALPSSYQAVFEAAAAEAARFMQIRYDDRNPAALERILESGVAMRPFSDELLDAAKEAAVQLMEDQAAGDPAYRKIYEAWKGARGKLMRWFGTSELAYASYAFRE